MGWGASLRVQHYVEWWQLLVCYNHCLCHMHARVLCGATCLNDFVLATQAPGWRTPMAIFFFHLHIMDVPVHTFRCICDAACLGNLCRKRLHQTQCSRATMLQITGYALKIGCGPIHLD